jgi:hypothetical protein
MQQPIPMNGFMVGRTAFRIRAHDDSEKAVDPKCDVDSQPRFHKPFAAEEGGG